LDGSIDDVETTLDVADASTFPATGNFRIRIDDELLLVTAVATNTFTVTRGAEGSVAASHVHLTPLTHVVTSGALDAFRQDNNNAGDIIDRQAPEKAGRFYIPDDGLQINRDDGALWTGYGPIYKFTKTPVVSDFSWVNQGSAIATDYGGSIHIDAPKVTTISWKLLVKTAPTPPYVITACFTNPFKPRAANAQIGLVFRDSATGLLSIVYGGSTASGVGLIHGVDNIASPTGAITALLVAAEYEPAPALIWLRIEDDGSDRNYSVSMDGVYWLQSATQPRTTYLTADQVGFGINHVRGGGASPNALFRLLSWDES
jgi:hypothetical protein